MTALALICLFLTGLLSGVILTVALAVYLDPKITRNDIRNAVRDDRPIKPRIIVPDNPFKK